MGIGQNIGAHWLSSSLEKVIPSSRYSLPRSLISVSVLGLVTYLIWLPISYTFRGIHSLSPRKNQVFIARPIEDALKHFAGSGYCSISQSDIYLVPRPMSLKISPFCKNRAALLEALSGGGRHGFDEPYVGKGCTYRWFSTAEICMILERFNAITFLGDDIAQFIYTAFNVLLREDLAIGGLQHWIMAEQDRSNCECDKQFLNTDCLGYAITSMKDVKAKSGAGGSGYFCERVPHAYISSTTIQATETSKNLFKSMTYSKPNPWQPSPVIFSFGHTSVLNITATILALDELQTLAIGAERNIPMLFLGPPAAADKNLAVWKYSEEMTRIAKEKQYDMLNLYNLTLQASSADGERYGEKVALVEAMAVINWLSKLETS